MDEKLFRAALESTVRSAVREEMKDHREEVREELKEYREDTNKLREMLTGNGDPEKGLILTVDRVVQQMAYQRNVNGRVVTGIGALATVVVGQLVSFVFGRIKVVIPIAMIVTLASITACSTPTVTKTPPPPATAVTAAGATHDDITRAISKLDDAGDYLTAEAKTPDPKNVQGAQDMVGGAKDDLHGGLAHAAAAQAAAQKDQRTIADQQKANPFDEGLTRWSIWLVIAGGALVIIGIIARVTSLGNIISTNIANLILMIGGGLIALAAFYMALIKLMPYLVTGFVVILIAAIVAALVWGGWWLYQHLKGKTAIKEIVSGIDAAVQTKAITWTADATAIMDGIQSDATKALVNAAQPAGLPPKPA